VYLFIDWWELNPSTGDYDYHSAEYHTLENLSFAPQADLTGNSLPVNEYTLDIITTDGIPDQVDTIELYDDLGQLWAAWPLRHVQRIAANCWRIRAASWVEDLDTITLPAKMYTTETAADVALECFGGDPSYFTVDAALQAVPISGFCPEQSARERLTWLVFVIGAYVCDTWRDDLLITAVDSTTTLIPFERTYWRPTVDTAEWVTAIRVTAYTFRQGTEEEWQEDENSYMFPVPWIATPRLFELRNPDAPGADSSAGTVIDLSDPDAPAPATGNVIELDALYLINPANVSTLLTRLAGYWFNPVEAQVACINNRQYRPGDLVTAYTDRDRLVMGYVTQATFAFGKQAKSALKLVGAVSVTGAKLTITYTYQGGVIGREVYYLPVGHTYSIQNPYIDHTWGDKRFVYRPQAEAVTGTIVDGDNAVSQAYDLALMYADNDLTIYSADAVTEQASASETVGVIA